MTPQPAKHPAVIEQKLPITPPNTIAMSTSTRARTSSRCAEHISSSSSPASVTSRHSLSPSPYTRLPNNPYADPISDLTHLPPAAHMHAAESDERAKEMHHILSRRIVILNAAALTLSATTIAALLSAFLIEGARAITVPLAILFAILSACSIILVSKSGGGARGTDTPSSCPPRRDVAPSQHIYGATERSMRMEEGVGEVGEGVGVGGVVYQWMRSTSHAPDPSRAGGFDARRVLYEDTPPQRRGNGAERMSNSTERMFSVII